MQHSNYHTPASALYDSSGDGRVSPSANATSVGNNTSYGIVLKFPGCLCNYLIEFRVKLLVGHIMRQGDWRLGTTKGLNNFLFKFVWLGNFDIFFITCALWQVCARKIFFLNVMQVLFFFFFYR